MMINSEDIRHFIEEDVGTGDLTALIIPAHTQATAEIVTREPMIMCGQPWLDGVIHYIDPTVEVSWQVVEGASLSADTLLCRLKGPARSLLTAERTALNLLQTLSATATTARIYADAVRGSSMQVLDTRKTIPGLRKAQKYAVRCGGCQNHRMGLFDGILIKENHILAAGSIAKAVEQAKALSAAIPIEIEVENIDEFREALIAGAERIMLDNFTLNLIREAVAINQGKAKLEVSGNADLTFVKAAADTGVDYVSVGALTKNVKAIDLSMRITLSGTD